MGSVRPVSTREIYDLLVPILVPERLILPFTRWEEVLKDKVLCSALVDRLCHKSYLVNMTGTSSRIKETKKLIGNK